MKKFKGGLYADLSNYNTTLPNTEILLNFFKSNPIGYRSGGMVRGIAGGNPTGMRVTGGFLANAQGYQPGGSVVGMSPYELGQYAEQQQRLPYLGTGEFAEKGAPLWSKERAKQELLDPEQLKLNISAYYQEPENLLSLLKKKKGIYTKPDGKTFEMPSAEFDFSPKTKGVTKKGKEVPIWDKDARKYENDKWKKYTEEEKKAAKKSAVDDLLDQYYAEGEMYDVDPSADTLPSDKKVKSDTTTAYTGGEGSSRMGDDGITGLTQDQINKIKEKRKETQVERELEQDLSKIKEPDLTDDKTEEKSASVSAIETKIKENKDNKNKKIVAPSAVTIVDGKAKNMFTMTAEEWAAKFQGMAGKTETELNKDEVSLSDRIAKALNPEKKDKGKEAPAWAMPLMMAGLQMAASNNPDMLGALAEGGIKGLEEHARIQKEKKEDEKYEKEMNLKKAGLIFDEEQIEISKDQMNLNKRQLSYNIASDAQKSFQEFSLANERLLQEGKISQEQLNFQYANMSQVLQMHTDDAADKLLTFMADHELKQEKLKLEGKALDVEWWKTQTGHARQTILIASEVNKNNALAKAAGFEMGTVESIEIGGKDMEVQIFRDEKGIHMLELGLSTDETSTALLQAYMRTNPDWHDEYTTDSAAFFEKLAAIKEMNDIIEGEGQKVNLSNIEEIPVGP